MCNSDFTVLPAKRICNLARRSDLSEANPKPVERACPKLVEWVSNGTAGKGVSFDNFLITNIRGKTRQINHYYPYGLRISGMDGYTHDYKNMYTSKELQTGEFDPSISTGLEM